MTMASIENQEDSREVMTPFIFDEEVSELNALRQQLKTLRERFLSTPSTRSSLEQVEALDERDQQIAFFQKEQQRFRHAIEFLRGRHQESQKQVQQLQEEIRQTRHIIVSFNERKRLDDQKIADEVAAKKVVLDEIVALRSQMDALKTRLSTTQREKDQLKRANDELLQRCDTTQYRLKDCEASLLEKETRLNSLEQFVSEAESRFSAVISEKISIQDDVLRAQNAKDDAEANLKIAQLHLAKKVKQTTDLSDQVQTQEIQIQDLRHSLSVSQTREQELQHEVEKHIQEESCLREQVQNASKSNDALTTHWDEKYSVLYQQWQKCETRLDELKDIEEKYQQLQAVWSNMGGLFGSKNHPIEQNN